MAGLEHAILGLRQALESPRRHHMWRWLVRHRLAAVKDALASERMPGRNAWLAAREQSMDRERAGLIQRVVALGPQVLEVPDVDPVRAELGRLVADLEHHRQRLNDLVYDAVSLELGGSE
ncbi:MAG: hypothetical protein ACXVYS_18515 [Oryzihumus sp.]